MHTLTTWMEIWLNGVVENYSPDKLTSKICLFIQQYAVISEKYNLVSGVSLTQVISNDKTLTIGWSLWVMVALYWLII